MLTSYNLQKGFLNGWKLDLQILNMFVSFCEPQVTCSSVLAIGTCLLWVLQGGFFTGNMLELTNDHKLVFLSKRFVHLSGPQHISNVEGQLKKQHGQINPAR